MQKFPEISKYAMLYLMIGVYLEYPPSYVVLYSSSLILISSFPLIRTLNYGASKVYS